MVSSPKTPDPKTTLTLKFRLLRRRTCPLPPDTPRAAAPGHSGAAMWRRLPPSAASPLGPVAGPPEPIGARGSPLRAAARPRSSRAKSNPTVAAYALLPRRIPTPSPPATSIIRRAPPPRWLSLFLLLILLFLYRISWRTLPSIRRRHGACRSILRRPCLDPNPGNRIHPFPA